MRVRIRVDQFQAAPKPIAPISPFPAVAIKHFACDYREFDQGVRPINESETVIGGRKRQAFPAVGKRAGIRPKGVVHR